MLVTREMLIKKLARESGYYEKDIRHLLHCLDNVVVECFDEATEEEEMIVQVVKGIRCGCKIVQARDRVDPRTREPIVCSETVKPFAKFSQDFRRIIQEQYKNKKNG